MRLSRKDPQNAINLLLLTGGRKKHYCWIKNLSALLNSQTTVKNNKKYFCLRCLKHFNSQEKLDLHIEVRNKKCYYVI